MPKLSATAAISTWPAGPIKPDSSGATTATVAAVERAAAALRLRGLAAAAVFATCGLVMFFALFIGHNVRPRSYFDKPREGKRVPPPLTPPASSPAAVV